MESWHAFVLPWLAFIFYPWVSALSVVLDRWVKLTTIGLSRWVITPFVGTWPRPAKHFHMPAHSWKFAAVLFLVFFPQKVVSQTTLVYWNFFGRPTGSFGPNGFMPTNLTTGLTTTGLMRGTNASASGAAGSTWGSDKFSTAATTSALAISASNYFFFTIAPTAGYEISFDSIAIYTLKRSGTGPNTIIWQYQIGSLSLAGTFTNISTLISLGALPLLPLPLL